MNHEEIGEGDFEIQVDNWKKMAQISRKEI